MDVVLSRVVRRCRMVSREVVRVFVETSWIGLAIGAFVGSSVGRSGSVCT